MLNPQFSANCEGAINVTNVCIVVGGEATLYLTSGADASSLTGIAQSAIEQSMNSGSMDAVDDHVVKVSYRSSDISGVASSSTPNEGSSTSSSIPFYTWIFVAMGIILLALVGYAYARKRRRRRYPNGDSASASLVSQLPENDIDIAILQNDIDVAYLQDPLSGMPAVTYSQKATNGTRLIATNPSLMPLHPGRAEHRRDLEVFSSFTDAGT